MRIIKLTFSFFILLSITVVNGESLIRWQCFVSGEGVNNSNIPNNCSIYGDQSEDENNDTYAISYTPYDYGESIPEFGEHAECNSDIGCKVRQVIIDGEEKNVLITPKDNSLEITIDQSSYTGRWTRPLTRLTIYDSGTIFTHAVTITSWGDAINSIDPSIQSQRLVQLSQALDQNQVSSFCSSSNPDEELSGLLGC